MRALTWVSSSSLCFARSASSSGAASDSVNANDLEHFGHLITVSVTVMFHLDGGCRRSGWNAAIPVQPTMGDMNSEWPQGDGLNSHRTLRPGVDLVAEAGQNDPV